MTTVDPQTGLKLALKKSLSQFFILENYPFTPFFQLKSRDRRYIFQLKKPKQIETTLKRHGSRESQNLVLWLIAKSSRGSRKVRFNRHALRSSFIKIWCCCLLNHATLFDWNDDFFLNKIVIFSSQNQFDRKSSSNCKKSSFQVRCITWFKRQQNRTFTNGDHLCAWRLDLNCTKLIFNLPLSCQIGSDLKILGAVDMFPFFNLKWQRDCSVNYHITRIFGFKRELNL